MDSSGIILLIKKNETEKFNGNVYFDCEGYMQSTNDYTRVIVCG